MSLPTLLGHREHWAAGALKFFLTAVASGLITFVFEMFLDPGLLRGLMHFQEQSYRAVAAFEPFALGSRYVRMVFNELNQPSRPTTRPRPFDCSTSSFGRTSAFDLGKPPPLWHCNPLSEPEADDSYIQQILKKSPTGARAVIAVPLTVYETFMQAPSIAGAVTLALQLAIGFSIATALTYKALEGNVSNVGGWSLIAAGTIGFGSLAALLTWILMLVGLALFGGFTRLAMLALGLCPPLYFYGMRRLEHATKRAAETGVHKTVDAILNSRSPRPPEA